MAKKQKSTTAPVDDALKNVSDYRHPEATRKNNPPHKSAPALAYTYARIQAVLRMNRVGAHFCIAHPV